MSFKFEYLSTEILYEIFDYLAIHDILRAFYNINTRFNSILFSSNIFLQILYPDDVQTSKFNQNLVLNSILNQQYLVRLRLIHDEDISEHSFIKLCNIRSLILDIPTTKHLQMISPEIFPQLQYLRIGCTSTKIQLSKLYHDIFSNAFPFLRKCSLNNINENKLWTGSPSIRSLGIGSDSPQTVVERVLVASMCLVSLHLFLNWPVSCAILDDQIIVQHDNLRYLKLHLHGYWTLDKLDSFLAYIPTVKKLVLHSSYFDPHMIQFRWNFQEFAYILLCRLPSLSYFDCEFIIKKGKIIDLENMQSLHPCFKRLKYEVYSEDDLYIRIFTN